LITFHGIVVSSGIQSSKLIDPILIFSTYIGFILIFGGQHTFIPHSLSLTFVVDVVVTLFGMARLLVLVSLAWEKYR
jgi:hypothetical protein